MQQKVEKILIVSNTFTINEGGATGIAFVQARALKNQGLDVFVFAGSFNNHDLGFREENGIKIFKIKIKNSQKYVFRSWLAMRNWRVENEFKKFLKDKNFDVIHFHNLYYQMPFSLIKIARKKCNKVFFTAHDVMSFSPQKLNFFVDKKWSLKNIDQVNYKFSWWRQLKQEKKAFNPFRNIYVRSCLKKCNKIFCVSHELEKALNQNKILNTITIRNGIDKNDWRPDFKKVEKVRQEFNLKNKKVLLFAGRLSGQKGGNIMLNILQKIKDRLPGIRLIVLGGDKKYLENMREEIKRLNMGNYIILIGKVARSQMKNYYKLADLTLVPSICFDSFPTINLESLACGIPIIATIFGGSREIIKHQKNGFLINPLDINNFTDKVVEFFQEKNLKVSENDLKNFTEKRWIERIISFY